MPEGSSIKLKSAKGKIRRYLIADKVRIRLPQLLEWPLDGRDKFLIDGEEYFPVEIKFPSGNRYTIEGKGDIKLLTLFGEHAPRLKELLANADGKKREELDGLLTQCEEAQAKEERPIVICSPEYYELFSELYDQIKRGPMIKPSNKRKALHSLFQLITADARSSTPGERKIEVLREAISYLKSLENHENVCEFLSTTKEIPEKDSTSIRVAALFLLICYKFGIKQPPLGRLISLLRGSLYTHAAVEVGEQYFSGKNRAWEKEKEAAVAYAAALLDVYELENDASSLERARAISEALIRQNDKDAYVVCLLRRIARLRSDAQMAEVWRKRADELNASCSKETKERFEKKRFKESSKIKKLILELIRS